MSNVVPGNLEVVTTSFSPTLRSINLLIKVDLPTFVVPTIYTSSSFLILLIEVNRFSIPSFCQQK